MMKLRDVLLKAMAKKIAWWAAAEIIGVSDRTMHRWRERFEESGYDGLMDRRKGKRASHRVELNTVEEVLRLYREHYSDRCQMPDCVITAKSFVSNVPGWRNRQTQRT